MKTNAHTHTYVDNTIRPLSKCSQNQCDSIDVYERRSAGDVLRHVPYSMLCTIPGRGGLQEEDPNDDRVEIPMTLIEVKKYKNL